MNKLMTLTKPALSLLAASRNNISYDVIWTSEPYLIGKTHWVFTIYMDKECKSIYTGYHFRDKNFCKAIPCSEWPREKDHPNYNYNDGTYAGLPKTLINLWEKHKNLSVLVLKANSKDAALEIIENYEKVKVSNEMSLFS